MSSILAELEAASNAALKTGVYNLTRDLVRRPSISPDDQGCQQVLYRRLQAVGFHINDLPFHDTSNFFALRPGVHHDSCAHPKVFMFAGHTDVVAPGDLSQWSFPPFELTQCENKSYGRGVSDMKGALAAMVVAAEHYVSIYPDHVHDIAFLVTSDEEGDFINGTPKVVEELRRQGQFITWCVIGEPSSEEQLADVIKVGRRGSVNATLTVQGIQGHVAYPQFADNPLHKIAPVLAALSQLTWDDGDDLFQNTALNITNISGGTGSNNVIPSSCAIRLNIRYTPNTPLSQIKKRIHELVQALHLDYQLRFTVSGPAFVTPSACLTDRVSDVIERIVGKAPRLSTGGGTSDGRFIIELGCEIIELGLLNESIHKVDEFCYTSDLLKLVKIYYGILEAMMKQ